MLEGMFKKTYTRIEAGHKAAKNVVHQSMLKMCEIISMHVQNVEDTLESMPSAELK